MGEPPPPTAGALILGGWGALRAPRPWWAQAGRIFGTFPGVRGGPGGPPGGVSRGPGGARDPPPGGPRGVSGGPWGAPGTPPGPPPGPPKMAENRPKMGPKMAQKRAENPPFFAPCGAKPRGGGGAPPTTLILLRNQWTAWPPAAFVRRRRRRDAGAGLAESPFGEVPWTARGAGQDPELVLRQRVGGLAPPGGYSLRHAGRVHLPTHRVLAALRPERLTWRPGGHTTFLAAREACIPRRRPAPNSLADTRRDNLLGLSPSPSGRRCRTPYGVDARRAFRAGKKKFFS